MHESKVHRYNCFLTLTLNDEHLTERYWTGKHYANGKPAYAGTLAKRDMQLFWKRLRKAYPQLVNRNLIATDSDGTLSEITTPYTTDEHPGNNNSRKSKISYYMCGEYGEQYRRPHYHACLFGMDFNDKKYFCRSPAGEKLYVSETLNTLWPNGYATIGAVTFESAAYVARYVMKKINGKKQQKHYEVIDQETGEIKNLLPEYNDMSRGRGNAIGVKFLNRYFADVYPAGQVIVRGKPSNAPRYYDKQYKKLNPLDYADLKTEREMEVKANWLENTHERLRVKEEVTKAKIRFLKRKI